MAKFFLNIYIKLFFISPFALLKRLKNVDEMKQKTTKKKNSYIFNKFNLYLSYFKHET